MNRIMQELIERANKPKDIDYRALIEENTIQRHPYEISKVEGQICYPIRNIDIEDTCNAYVLEDGKIIGNLNTLYGLNGLCFTDILGGDNIILTKDFSDVLFLKDKGFPAVGLLDECITSRQYEELLRVIGLKKIYILFNPNIENRILTFKIIKKLYPLFEIRVCTINKEIVDSNKEEIKGFIEISKSVSKEHFKNVDKYIKKLEGMRENEKKIIRNPVKEVKKESEEELNLDIGISIPDFKI